MTLQERTHGSTLRNYNVVGQVPMDLLHSVIGMTLDRHISTHSHFGDAVGKVGAKLLSTNRYMAPIAAFMQRRVSETITTKHITTKMEEQMNALVPDSAAKHVRSKSVSLPSCTDLAHSTSSSSRKED